MLDKKPDLPNKTQKLTIFLPSLTGGGAERVMVQIANSMDQRGYAVDLVLARAEGPYLRDVAPGVRVIDLKARRALYSFPKLLFYLHKKEPNTLLSALEIANILAAAAKKISLCNFRLVVSARNSLESKAKHRKTKAQKIKNLASTWAYNNCDRVISVSHGVASEIRRTSNVPSSRLSVIFNPVDIEDIQQKAQHPWPLKSHTIKKGNKPLLLAAGRLVPQKGFSYLLTAFALLRKSRDACLIIIGEGDSRSELESLAIHLGIENDVIMPGFVKNPFALMKEADVFILSSLWEGLPNVLIHAMACGTQVVSTDCHHGPKEILEGGAWGDLVPPKNAAALAKAIEATLDRQEKPDVIKRSIDFEKEKIVEEYLRELFPTT